MELLVTLQDVYDYLSYGEFSQLFLSGTGIDIGNVSSIPRDKFPQLLPLVVLGLTELYKRFELREGTELVNLVAEEANYTLVATDLLKVERVYGTYYSNDFEIPLNRIGDPVSIRTPSYNKLTVPIDSTEAAWLTETTQLNIKYRANHPVLDKEAANCFPDNIELELPSTYLEPLVYYVASKVLTPRGASREFNPGATYTMKFEAAVAQLKLLNFQVDSDIESTLLSDRGFA